MPTAGFKCKVCGERWTVEEVTWEGARQEDAFAHFETAHGENYHLTRDLLYTIALKAAQDNDDPRRNGTSFTASMAGGCMRETCLSRTEEVWRDPLKEWLMCEGTVLHAGLSVAPGWESETLYEGTIYGMAISGRTDRVSHERRVVRDLKTHAAPYGSWSRLTKEERAAGKASTFEYYRKVYPPGEGETLQLNLLARLVEAKHPEAGAYAMEITPLQKGVKDATLASPLEMPVERMTDEALEARVRPQYEAVKSVMGEPDLSKRRTLIGGLPLEGRTMYKRRDGAVKCDFACAVRDYCDALLPDVERF